MSKTSEVPSESDFLIRTLSTNRLAVFAEAFVPGFRAAPVHDYLAGQLERVAAGACPRLCVSMPPRHGKTTLISEAFPAWLLTKQPATEVIVASYSSELSERIALGIRAILDSEAYRQTFPPICDPSFARSRQWTTLAGGGVFATGVGGGATGRGADLLIIDDPIKNAEEAKSSARREEVWRWFCSVAMTRLSPSGSVLIVGTRWNRDDLIGRLTSADYQRGMSEAGLGDEAFRAIALPALCESITDPLQRALGEPLWPTRWPVSKLDAQRVTLGPREFAALYQQRPAPVGGQLVDVSKIRIIERHELPIDLKLARGWDLAVSERDLADYSVGALGGMDRDGKFYLVHIDRARRAWLAQKQRMCSLAQAECAEGGAIGVETVSAFAGLAAEVRESLGGRVIVREVRPKTDKTARAMPWLAKVDAGMFHIVRGSWNVEFLDELEQFPNGAHDDQIDAISVLFAITGRRDVLLMA